jgi:hypothetical protein
MCRQKVVGGSSTLPFVANNDDWNVRIHKDVTLYAMVEANWYLIHLSNYEFDALYVDLWIAFMFIMFMHQFAGDFQTMWVNCICSLP